MSIEEHDSASEVPVPPPATSSVDPSSVEGLFLAALARPAEERAQFLAEHCLDDEQRRRVTALLRAYDDAGSFLEDSPVHHAGRDIPGDLPSDFLGPTEKPGCLGTLGAYEVIDVIGRGGMGVVFRALDPQLNRIVAIKALAPELAANPNARRRFTREAQAAAAISHPHVVTIHAVDSSQLPYLVMECVVGQSLQEKLDHSAPLRLTEILRIGKQITEGLAAAHEQGLIHRDIKPSNILLENGVERVKITDFGLARTVDDVTITRTGEVSGTPQYMSPEQARGDKVDHRSDLFSFGCVLYAMCTGRSPFRANGLAAAVKRVCEDVPRPVMEVNPEIPPWLAELIDRLLAKQPDQRPETAHAVGEILAERLSSLQRGESPFHERPAPPPRRVMSSPVRLGSHRTPRESLSLFAAPTLALLAGIATGTFPEHALRSLVGLTCGWSVLLAGTVIAARGHGLFRSNRAVPWLAGSTLVLLIGYVIGRTLAEPRLLGMPGGSGIPESLNGFIYHNQLLALVLFLVTLTGLLWIGLRQLDGEVAKTAESSDADVESPMTYGHATLGAVFVGAAMGALVPMSRTQGTVIAEAAVLGAGTGLLWILIRKFILRARDRLTVFQWFVVILSLVGGQITVLWLRDVTASVRVIAEFEWRMLFGGVLLWVTAIIAGKRRSSGRHAATAPARRSTAWKGAMIVALLLLMIPGGLLIGGYLVLRYSYAPPATLVIDAGRYREVSDVEVNGRSMPTRLEDGRVIVDGIPPGHQPVTIHFSNSFPSISTTIVFRPGRTATYGNLTITPTTPVRFEDHTSTAPPEKGMEDDAETGFGALIVTFPEQIFRQGAIAQSVTLTGRGSNRDFSMRLDNEGNFELPAGTYGVTFYDGLYGWVDLGTSSPFDPFDPGGGAAGGMGMMMGGFGMESESMPRARYTLPDVSIKPGDVTAIAVDRSLEALTADDEDFSEKKIYRLQWNGEMYLLSQLQAQLINHLIHETAAGTDRVAAAKLLKAIERPEATLRGIFNDSAHPALKGVIEVLPNAEVKLRWPFGAKSATSDDEETTASGLSSEGGIVGYGTPGGGLLAGGRGFGASGPGGLSGGKPPIPDGIGGVAGVPFSNERTVPLNVDVRADGLLLAIRRKSIFDEATTLREETVSQVGVTQLDLPPGLYEVLIRDELFGWSFDRRSEMNVGKSPSQQFVVQRDWESLRSMTAEDFGGARILFKRFLWNGQVLWDREGVWNGQASEIPAIPGTVEVIRRLVVANLSGSSDVPEAELLEAIPEDERPQSMAELLGADAGGNGGSQSESSLIVPGDADGTYRLVPRNVGTVKIDLRHPGVMFQFASSGQTPPKMSRAFNGPAAAEWELLAGKYRYLLNDQALDVRESMEALMYSRSPTNVELPPEGTLTLELHRDSKYLHEFAEELRADERDTIVLSWFYHGFADGEGQPYHQYGKFDRSQRQCLAVLIDALASGTPALTEAEILQRAGLPADWELIPEFGSRLEPSEPLTEDQVAEVARRLPVVPVRDGSDLRWQMVSPSPEYVDLDFPADATRPENMTQNMTEPISAGR